MPREGHTTTAPTTPTPDSWGWIGAGAIPVDEYQEEGALVVRAELPGIDPETDVELTISDHALHIEAERREEEKVKKKGYLRHEVRCGSFSRTLPLPEGVTEADITANYKDGFLEIRIPTPAVEPGKKIAITKTRPVSVVRLCHPLTNSGDTNHPGRGEGP